MGSFDEVFCENCQMSFETKDLLSLHSCADIKEEISELDVIISDDPLSIYGIEEEIDPLSKVSEMINEGNVELTKAIDMVHQYNLKVQEGKDLYDKKSVVHEQRYKLNQSAKLVDARQNENPSYTEIIKKNENPSYTEIIKIQPQKFKKMQKCKKCNKSFNSVKNLQKHKLIHAEVKPYSCSYCTMKFRRKDLAEKHMNLKHKYTAKDFCEICSKEVASKYYLKVHMLRKHQVEIINSGKNQMKEQTEYFHLGKYQLTKDEVVNRTEDIHKNSIEEKVPFFYHSEIKQHDIPKYEEIKVKPVFISENSCKMDPLVERKNIKIRKAKKKNRIDRKDMQFLTPPNPSEMITKRHIFDYIHSSKITPGNYRNSDYQKYVFETVLTFKKVTINKLSETSVKKLETKASGLTIEIYRNWRKCGHQRGKFYKNFYNDMQDPFVWLPELVYENKKENVEVSKPKIEKSDKKYVPLLLSSNSSELLTKRQIFDDIYSRKITPGQCKNFEYEKHVLETVLKLNKVTIDKLSELSIKKLKTKANSLTSGIYKHWRKCHLRLYTKFNNNMEDPFDWIPELLHEENKENIEIPKAKKQKTDKKDMPLLNLNNKQNTDIATSNTYTYLKLFESVRGKKVSVKHGSPELIRAVSECLADLWDISFDRGILEENKKNSKFWPVVKDFTEKISRFWRQSNGNRIVMLRHHHVFFNKLRIIEDLIQDDRNNLESMEIASEIYQA